MWDHDPMDTANLEHAARRYREAEAALDGARTDLQTEAVTFLQQNAGERGSQATAVRITGWSREHLRSLDKKAREEAERIRREAEVETLRRKVEELSAPVEVPPAAPAKTTAPAPKRRRGPEPRDGRPLTDEEAVTLVALARSRATELQGQKLDQDAAQVGEAYKNFTVVSSAMAMGLLSHDEVYGERPVSSEEQTG